MLFTSETDLSTQQRFLRESAILHNTSVLWFSIDLSVDIDLYGEPSSSSKFKDPVTVHIHFEYNPTEKNLDKYGLTEKVEMLVDIPESECERAGITPKPGDVFRFYDREYTVGDVKMGNPFGYNMTHYVFSASIRKPSNISDNRLPSDDGDKIDVVNVKNYEDDDPIY